MRDRGGGVMTGELRKLLVRDAQEVAMGTARMNVWVTEVGDPCKIDLQHQWYVHVLNCDGTLLTWCRDGRERTPYTNIETRCGHAEFEVPPGQYTVMATWSQSAGDPHQLGNHLTHLQVVRV